MKKFRKSFGNKIVAFVLILLLLMDALPFTSYAVHGSGSRKSVIETVKTDEPDVKEEDAKDTSKNPDARENNNEIQEEPEIKDPETKKPEVKEPEVKEPEGKEQEVKETEIIEPKIEKPEIKESEIKEQERGELEVKEPGTNESQGNKQETGESRTEGTSTGSTENSSEQAASEIFSETTSEIASEAASYEVTVSKNGEGKIEIDKVEVSSVFVAEGKSIEITLTPADGYMVGDVLIDNSSIFQNTVQDVSYAENADNTSDVVIANINAAKNVTVKFENILAEESKEIDDFLHIVEEPGKEKGRRIPEAEKEGVKERVYSAATKLEIKDAVGSSDIQFRIRKKGDAYSDWKDGIYEILSSCELEEVQMRTKNKHDTCVVKCLSDLKLVIDTEAPTAQIQANAPDESRGENGYYIGDFSVSVTANDSISGIESVTYLITDTKEVKLDEIADDKWKKIDDAAGADGSEAVIETDAEGTVTATINVSTETYNSDWVRVWIKIKDKADNEWRSWEDKGMPECYPVITQKPAISVAVAGNSQPFDVRKMTITITDRPSAFVKENLMLNVTAADIEGNELDASIAESVKNAVSGANAEWVETEDGKKQTVTFTFKASACYQWEITGYKNKAGLSADVNKIATEGEDIWGFTVDSEKPELELKYETKIFNKLCEVLSFHLFSQYDVTVVGTVSDSFSGIDEETNPVLYYKTVNQETVFNENELEEIYKAGKFSENNNKITADEGLGSYVIYARAQDKAGNFRYVCTDNIIIDNTPSDITIEPQPITLPTAHESNGYGIYRDDFNVDITVSEKKGDSDTGVHSGIKTVKYSIKKEYTDGGSTKEEYTVKNKELFSFAPEESNKGATAADFVEFDKSGNLVYTYKGSIPVPVKENENCKVRIVVETTDNAGNKAESSKLTIKTENGETEMREWLDIDDKKPEVSISYRDNDENKDALKAGCFNNERTAALKIVERTAHFDGDAALNAIRITATDENGDTKVIHTKRELLAEGFLPTDQWTTTEGSTPDEASHTIDIMFSDDAKYKIEFNYTDETGDEVVYKDKAGNESNHLEDEFIVDRTAPTGFVTVVPKTRDEAGNISSGEASRRSEKNSIAEEIVFGFSNVSIDVNADGSDNMGPVKIEYFQTDSAQPMSVEELEKAAFGEFEPSVFSDEACMVLYFKLTDYAGNRTYLRSDGWIIDKSVSTVIKFDPSNVTESGEPVYFNSDIDASVEIEDAGSGIQGIEYWVVKDGATQTQEEILFPENSQNKTLNVKLPYSKVKKKELKKITIDSAKNNSCDVEVFVRITDNAGNIVTKSKKYDIDITPPEITITYDNNKAVNKSYFNSDRTATIRIKEREHHFDADKVTDGIKITGYDSRNKQLSGIKKSEMISGWTLEKGNSPDEAVFTAQIKYTKDANYKFVFHNAQQEEEKNKYRDKAGNLSGDIDWGDSIAPEEFTIDKTKPVVSVTASPQGGESKTWDKLLGSRTFAIWSNSGIGVSASYEDAVSGIDKVQYYKSTDAGAESEKSLAKKSWKDFKSLTISPNEQAAVYIKVTDKSGNIAYVSTDGLVADNMPPTITLRMETPETGIYNSDATVFVDVQEALSEDQFAGLKSVSYKIFNMGKETQNGTLFSFSEQAPSRSQLSGKWTGEIKVDSSLNNSNDVVVEVYANDNALNSATQKAELQIDVTKPTIEVSYSSNSPDSERYYKEPRTATIVVTERNFDAKDIEINITNEDQAIPMVSEWVKKEGDGNLDNTTHTATITYSDDGDYTFDMKYTDVAENECEGVTYADGTVNETEFTIDTTLPEIRVSYDNNNAQNNEYFNEGRTATITVTEHNFDVGRVNLTQTALLEGRNIPIPNARWQDNGDVHTAVIPYLDDGDYTFDVSMADMAGNENGGVNYAPENASKTFTIDTAIDEPVITGVENGKAYKGDVVPVITLADANFDTYEAVLTRTRLDEKDVDVTDQFIKRIATGSRGGSGESANFEAVQENDGIYTLNVKMNDKAGNESESTVQFTVNRFGSVYAYNDYLINLIKNGGGYVQSVEEDLVITEYNADKLVNGSVDIEITRDGKPLESPEYTIWPEVNGYVSIGESGWYQYRYDISSSNFKNDGIYKISVASKDETGNAPENTNYKDKGILFTVDSAAPEITSITGLENSIVNASELTVNYMVYDTVGMKSISVYLDGELLGDAITDLGGDINNYAGNFVIHEADRSQSVRIVVEDLAGNITDTSAEDFKSAYAFHSMVTVSTNMFVRLFANKILVWSGIGILAVMMAAAAGTVVYRKKRKTESN